MTETEELEGLHQVAAELAEIRRDIDDLKSRKHVLREKMRELQELPMQLDAIGKTIEGVSESLLHLYEDPSGDDGSTK